MDGFFGLCPERDLCNTGGVSTREQTFIPSGATEALEWITVLSAAGCDYRLTRGDDGSWYLHVPRMQAATAWADLCRFESERLSPSLLSLQPIPEVKPAEGGPALWTAFWLAYVLVLYFLWFGPYDGSNNVLQAGAASSGAIMSGEWWRCITALTLHSGWPHLLANVFFILAVGQAVVHGFGRGLGLVLMLGGGMLGNSLAAWVSEPDQVGVGSSTMGFAALGVMSVHQTVNAFKRWRRWRAVWRRAWLPMASGLALLGMMGTGPQSDLAGHAFGFIAGAVLVLPFSLPSRPPGFSGTVQWALTLLALALPLGSWFLAWWSV